MQIEKAINAFIRGKTASAEQLKWHFHTCLVLTVEKCHEEKDGLMSVSDLW